jgi:hypothetical protein
MNPFLKLFLNPFEKIAGYKAFALGLFIAFISTFLAYLFNTRFDGVLDIHFVSDVTFFQSLKEQIINIASLIIVFYLAGLIIKGNKFRFADISGTLTFARFPLLFAPFLNMSDYFFKIGQLLTSNNWQTSIDTTNLIFLIAAIVVLLVIIIWYISLLYKAYKISTNIKGGKLIASFIIGLLASEVLSKVLIFHS